MNRHDEPVIVSGDVEDRDGSGAGNFDGVCVGEDASEFLNAGARRAIGPIRAIVPGLPPPWGERPEIPGCVTA